MTLIVSWIGVDNKKKEKKISSLYIVSDSRYSWKGVGSYDNGVKVFGCLNFPEIFGFCGDVLFPSNILSQVVSHIDNGLMFKKVDTHIEKFEKVKDYISKNVKHYPKNAMNQSFTILHGTRIDKEFYLNKLCFNHKTYILTNELIPLPNISTKIFAGGSGSKEFDKNWLHYENKKHNENETSRGVFQCFTKTLESIKDPYTGGAPQIVGLYRVRNSIIFGSILKQKLYLYGNECVENINFENIEWRNENFERADPNTGLIILDAQKQPFKK